MSLMARLVDVSGADLVSSNVSSTADDYSATEPYVTDEEVNYGDRVYVALAGTTFPVGQSSIQTATPGDAIWHGGQLEIGDTVAFTSSNTLPTGISANTLYYVMESDAPALPFSTWFSVSTTQGGSAVNITGTGTGTLTVHRNPVFGVTPGTDDTKWLNSRPTNEWAMFDNFTLTKTSNSTSIAVGVTPGSRFNVIGLLGLANASTVAIAIFYASATGNLVTQPYAFDHANWTKGGTTPIVVTANAAAAPNGATEADKIVSPNTVIDGNVFQAPTLVALTAYTFSVYAKKAEWNWTMIELRGNSGDAHQAWFDLDSGAVGTVTSGATNAIQSVGNGWYRCSITYTTGASVASPRARIYPTNADNTQSAGNGTSGIYIWGAMLRAGSATIDTYASYDLTETAFSDDDYASVYSEAVYKDRLAVSNIDPYDAATAYITISGSGTVQCGSCLFGLSKDIGDAQYGAQAGIDNYTRIERDEFGGIQIDATRGYSDNAEYEAWFLRAKAGALRKLFADYKDTPALFLMAPDDDQPGGWDATGIHHGLASFRITLSNPSHYLCRLEIDGVT